MTLAVAHHHRQFRTVSQKTKKTRVSEKIHISQSVVLNRPGSLDSGNDRALELLHEAKLPEDETPYRSSREVQACEPLSDASSLGGGPSGGSELNLSIQSQVSHFASHTSLLYLL